MFMLYNMLSYVMLYNTSYYEYNMLCLCYITCYLILYNMLCLCYVTLYNMLSYVMLYNILCYKTRYVMLCYVI